MRRLLAAGFIALLLVPALARPASAHPLGNYTVNRAVAVTIAADHVALLYLVDMAEIPTFNEIAAIDRNADGSVSPAEANDYADAACARALDNLDLRVGTTPLRLAVASEPELDLLPGAGGLQTLRLACHFAAPSPTGGSLAVVDRTDDGHVGWREVTIAAAGGVHITEADVSDRSESAHLSAYPTGRLESPPDVRQGHASFQVVGGAPQSSSAVLAAPATNPRTADPLAALLEGELSPAVVLLALLLAAGLGAAHALSPGHGKTLVAAYLVGSGGTMRQAVALGLTVAFAHTAGVLLLGMLVLVAGELLLPETLIGWLTIVSGALMAMLGAGLVWRALSGGRSPAMATITAIPTRMDAATSHEHAPPPERSRAGDAERGRSRRGWRSGAERLRPDRAACGGDDGSPGIRAGPDRRLRDRHGRGARRPGGGDSLRPRLARSTSTWPGLADTSNAGPAAGRFRPARARHRPGDHDYRARAHELSGRPRL